MLPKSGESNSPMSIVNCRHCSHQHPQGSVRENCRDFSIHHCSPQSISCHACGFSLKEDVFKGLIFLLAAAVQRWLCQVEVLGILTTLCPILVYAMKVAVFWGMFLYMLGFFGSGCIWKRFQSTSEACQLVKVLVRSSSAVWQ